MAKKRPQTRAGITCLARQGKLPALVPLGRLQGCCSTFVADCSNKLHGVVGVDQQWGCFSRNYQCPAG